VHLPLLWLDLASLNEDLRQASVSCIRRAVEVTRALDVQTYTLHLWGMTTMQIVALLEEPAQREAILGGALAQAGRSLGEVCAFLDPRDVCVENLESPPFEAVLPLVERAGASICLDVGHLAWQGADPLAFLAQHGARVREVHLHDAARAGGAAQGRVRDHLALGHGEIDYRAILDALARREYDGAVILEVNHRADLEESVEQVRAYL
jgi:sugar phosphate isomerase/epimerase